MTEEFLARYGLTAWIPEPVNHRRRVRRLPTVPARFQNVFLTFGCGGSVAVLVAIVVAWLTDPPLFFWWTFGNSSVTVLAVLAGRAAYKNAQLRRAGLTPPRQRIADAAAQAERRRNDERRQSFNDS